ncbi:acrosin-like protein [Dinothrombium tinctorium]|uniref:Acrosin-like protein n=1 Tax=Dinothrombium tinctorium TaxID=1965070 RepID=A0A3S3QE34_9ACAR|nr:acrosin-like protein [Dinothrombium tinctorium]
MTIAAFIIEIAIYSLLIIGFGETAYENSDQNCGRLIFSNGGDKNQEKYYFSSIVSLKLFDRNGREDVQKRHCTGSIISKHLILTAASCFSSHTQLVEVIFGSEDGKGYKVSSKSWKKHEDYNEKEKANDLAVNELNDEISYDDYKKPICLPIKHFGHSFKSYNLIDLNEKQLLNVLKKSIVQIIDTKKCKSFALSKNRDQICAENEKPSSNFRPGALLFNEEKRREIIVWRLVGILSSFDPSSKHFLFTNISSHLDWLNKKIKSSEVVKLIDNQKCGAANFRRTKRIIDGNVVSNPNPYPWTK